MRALLSGDMIDLTDTVVEAACRELDVELAGLEDEDIQLKSKDKEQRLQESLVGQGEGGEGWHACLGGRGGRSCGSRPAMPCPHGMPTDNRPTTFPRTSQAEAKSAVDTCEAECSRLQAAVDSRRAAVKPKQGGGAADEELEDTDMEEEEGGMAAKASGSGLKRKRQVLIDDDDSEEDQVGDQISTANLICCCFSLVCTAFPPGDA